MTSIYPSRSSSVARISTFLGGYDSSRGFTHYVACAVFTVKLLSNFRRTIKSLFFLHPSTCFWWCRSGNQLCQTCRQGSQRHGSLVGSESPTFMLIQHKPLHMERWLLSLVPGWAGAITASTVTWAPIWQDVVFNDGIEPEYCCCFVKVKWLHSHYHS